jgi:hypothetical protein
MRTLALALPLTLLSQYAAAQSLPFTTGWDNSGASVRVERGDRGDELVVENGIAYRRDVALEDGTIDFDVNLSDRRSFVYISFRLQNDDEFEEFYLRAHKSGLPDAVQYAPVRQRQSAWQLFHGAGSTAAARFETRTWTPVRVVLQGRKAALFIGDLTTPALVVHELRHDPRPGYISVRCFTDTASPGAQPAARYANVRVRPGEVPFTFPPTPAAAPATGLVIKDWSVSKAVLPASVADGALPDSSAIGPFTSFRANDDGLLEMHRWVRLPEGSRAAAAVARVSIRSATARVAALDLGFSDVATVFLNGRPLFRGDGTYSFDGPRRDGLIGFDNARLYLPLQAGDNDLALVVSDSFGGWGLMARLPDPAGLTVTAR